MQVAILAGGLATRLGSLTREQPKSMVRVHGRPFLEYQLENLSHDGVRDVVLCIGHLGEQIEERFEDGRRFGVNIKYSHEGERLLGTAGALKNAVRLLDSEFFVMYGDSYLFLDYNAIMAYFRGHNKLGLMVVYQNRDLYDKSNVMAENGIVKVYNKSKKSDKMIYIDYGASILRKETLELVPPDEIYPLDNLFASLVEHGELLAYEVYDRFYEIGSPQGLREFEKYISERKGSG